MEGCEGCGGVWLGPEAAVHVLRGLGDDREREIARATAVLEMRAVGAPPADPGARECPTCAQVMGRLPVGATIVDSCPAHGTWFDSREIGEVIVACGALRRRHSTEKGDKASPDSVSPEDAAYQAMDHEGRGQGHHHAWNVFGRLLSAVLELIPN